MAICLTPVRIRNPVLDSDNDNILSALIADKDISQYIDVPCGHCLPCLQRKRRQWFIRLMYEFKRSSSAVFITLTIDDNHQKRNDLGWYEAEKNDIQKFFKRFRKLQDKRYGKKNIKYFMCCEYGPTTLRPHYHLILFNAETAKLYENLVETYHLGFFQVGNVTEASIMYCAKYCLGVPDFALSLRDVKPFLMVSKGLGSNMLKDMKFMCDNGYISYKGTPYKVPDYVLEKMPAVISQMIRLKARKYIKQQLDELSPEEYLSQITRNDAQLKKLIKKSKL